MADQTERKKTQSTKLHVIALFHLAADWLFLPTPYHSRNNSSLCGFWIHNIIRNCVQMYSVQMYVCFYLQCHNFNLKMALSPVKMVQTYMCANPQNYWIASFQRAARTTLLFLVVLGLTCKLPGCLSWIIYAVMWTVKLAVYLMKILSVLLSVFFFVRNLNHTILLSLIGHQKLSRRRWQVVRTNDKFWFTCNTIKFR